MGERQERTDFGDEVGQHLHRVGSVRTRNLHDEHKHADCLTHIAETHHHRIGEEREHQRGQPSRQHKQQRMHGLHAQEQQIATERHRGLQQRNQREHPVMPKEEPMRPRIAQCFARPARHGGFQRHHHQQRAHPQRQQRVERCHRRTEIRHREYGLAPELHRCGQRTGQRFGIIAQHLFDHAHIATV